MGQQLWATKIAKNNTMGGSKIKYVHYKAFNYNDRTILLYNGNRKNLNLTTGKPERALGIEDAAIMMTVVNSDGTYNRSIVLEGSDLSNYKLRPQLGKWLTEDTILLYLESTKNDQKHRLAKLRILD